jgi:flagellar biosynthetic protein FliR
MLISIAQAQIFFLVLTRVLAILVQVPVFGSAMIPNQIKVALGIILSMIVIPWKILPPDAPVIPLEVYAVAILQELIVGLLAGFAGNLTFGAFQTAGKLMDLGSGFGAGQIFNPTLGETGSSLEQFFVMVAMLLFLAINGHHGFLLGLQKTFEILPVHAPLPAILPDRLLSTMSALFMAGVQMALPVMAALFMTDLALGLVGRAAPQVNVFFLGLPVKVWLGVTGLSLALIYLMPFFGDLFGNLGNRVIYLLGA